MTNFLVQWFTTFFEFIHRGVMTVFSAPEISYGLTIIVFTVIVRLCLLPLTIKQLKSTSKMSEIQPEQKRIQEKYKNDPQRSQQEMMKLYKEHGVNPLSGCLPLLVQFPILIALFTLFKSLQGIEGVGFLLLPWINDLSAPDPYFILPTLSALTTFLSTKLMQPAGGGGNTQTNTMNIVMTVFIFWVSIKFSAALVIYWTINNLFQLGQSLIMKKNKLKEDPSKA